MKKSSRQEHQTSFVMFHLNLILVVVLLIRDQIQWVLSKFAHFTDEIACLKKLKEAVSEMMSQITALIISNTEIQEELKSQRDRTKALEDNLKDQDGGEVLRQRRRNNTSDMPDDYDILKRDIQRLSQALEVMQASLGVYERELQNHNQVIGISSINMTDIEQDVRQLERTSFKGILLWKIDNFAKRKREAINGSSPSFYSPYFYSSRYGYKMCARIYLNGDGIGKGTHISLFFVIRRGEYDALLRWPFRQKVTMMILDQNSMEHMIDAFKPDPSSSSFQRPVNEMNVASGCPTFCPLSDLTKHAYIRDDCMFVKIIVDKTNY
jgi:hypothetical protein